jgi:hypothetical protein
VAGICSAHMGDEPVEGCSACHAIPSDLFPRWGAMVVEADLAGKAICECGFEFYLTTPACPLCGSRNYTKQPPDKETL